MSRITVAMVDNLAHHLLVKRKAILEKAQEEYTEFIRAEYLKTIPEEVLAFNKKFPGWISTSSTLTITGPGISKSFWVDLRNPYVIEKYNSHHFVITAKQSEGIVKAKNKIEKEQEAYKALFLETRTAISSLGTSKRVIEAFPELEKFFVPNETKAVVVNIQDLKKRISSDK